MAAVTTIGLVLGAGGLHAAAHHAGTLAALAEAPGWDPRPAAGVVGPGGEGEGSYVLLAEQFPISGAISY